MLSWLAFLISLAFIFYLAHFKKGIDYTSKLSIQPIPAAKIGRNAKFAAFWSVFKKEIKVDPEILCK